jgi:conserved hypothetical protein
MWKQHCLALGSFILILSVKAHSYEPISSAGVSQQKEKIEWALFNFPPFIATKSAIAEGNAVNRILNDLQARMPEYKHSNSVVSVSTLMTMLKQKRKVCSAWVYRTEERESLAYFTSFFPIPSQGLVVRASDMDRFRDVKKLSLQYLLENTNFHLGLEKGRAYGEIFDKIIREAPQDKIIYVEGPTAAEALIKMLMSGRINYILEFPQVVAYYNESLKLSPSLYFSYLEEAAPMRVVNIVCTKSRWGRLMSRRIDLAMQDLAKDPEFPNLVEVYYPEDVKKKYRKDFDNFYRERARGPMTTAPIGR